MDAQPDAAVLRQATLGDVEIGHDLDARDHRRGEPARRRLDFMQHTVDAVAHDQTVFKRLEMDVGRAHFQRVGDDERHQAYHRRFGREVLQLLDIGIESDVVALLDIADDLSQCRLARAVEALQRSLELGGNRDLRLDLAPGDHLERVHGVQVGGIGHRQRELFLVFGQRQRARLAQKARRDTLLQDGHFRISGGFDEWQPELSRERLGDVSLRNDAERHKQRTELFAGLLLQPQRTLESRGVELAALDQNFADAFFMNVVQCFDCTNFDRWMIA